MDKTINFNRTAKVILKFTLFVLIYLCIMISANTGRYLVPYIFSAMVILLFLARSQTGILAFVPFMLMSPWTSRLDIRSTEGLASIHTIYFKGFNLFTYMLIFFSMCSLAQYLRKYKTLKFTTIEKSFFLIVAAYMLSAFVGIRNFFIYPRQYIADIAPLINMICGFLIVRLGLRDPVYLKKLFRVLVYTFSAMAFVALVWFVSGSGYSKGVALMPIYDPVGVFPVFLISLSLAKIILDRRSKKENIFYIIMLLLGFSFFLLWPSRAQLIVVVFSLLFIASILSKKELIVYGGILSIIAVSLFVVLDIIVPNVLAYSMWKISTLKYIVLALDAPGTVSQRLIEGYNILLKLWNDGSILWGSGAGSWFDDSYRNFPFLFENEKLALSAFSEDQLFYWRFFRPHDTFLFVLLKSGLLGLSFYLVFIAVFLRNIRREILRTKYSFRSIVLAASAVPFLSQFLGFSAKNYVMAGILFGIIINAALAQTSYQYALDENTISEG